MPRPSRDDDSDAIRITTAASGKSLDIATRQKRYLLSMSLRSACFVGAVIAALSGADWLWPFLIAGAIVLPYIAVVLANVATTRAEGFELRGAPGQHPELKAGAGSRD